MKRLQLSDDRRAEIVDQLCAHFQAEFDEDLSEFKAGEIVDLCLRLLGPAVYNQAVQDVRAHFQGKLDDLAGEVFADS
ncbi:MAG: DUF2164 domain-containing protein [Pseudomonadota bacterium]